MKALRGTKKEKIRIISYKRMTAGLFLLLITTFLAITPKYFESRLKGDPYRKWLDHRREPQTTMISIWHIVDFKPCVGSLGTWLEGRAKRYFALYNGVYFDVEAMSPEDAEEQFSRGRRPDVISFSHGRYGADMLLPLTDMIGSDNSSGVFCGELYALPYCASGRFLVFSADGQSGADTDRLTADAGTAEEFKRGKKPSCICDIRGTGDLMRAQMAGKCPYFETVPLDEQTELVQYAALYSGIDPVKLPYSLGFIEYLLSDPSQKSLVDLGVMPIKRLAVDFEQDWIDELYSRFQPESIPSCFE